MKILKELGLLFHSQKEIEQFIQFDKINETINKIKKNKYSCSVIANKLKLDWSKKIKYTNNKGGHEYARKYLECLNKLSNLDPYNVYCEETRTKENKESYASFHIDHIKPSSKGGSNNLMNLRLIVPTKNLRKGNKEIIYENKSFLETNEAYEPILALKLYEENILKNEIKNIKTIPQQLDISHLILMIKIYIIGIKNRKDYDNYLKEIEKEIPQNFIDILLFSMFFEAKKEKQIILMYSKRKMDYSSQARNKKELLLKKMRPTNDQETLFKSMNEYLNKNYNSYLNNFSLIEKKFKYSSLVNSKKEGYFKAFYFSLIESGFFKFYENRFGKEDEKELIKEILISLKCFLVEGLDNKMENLTHEKYKDKNNSYHEKAISSTLKRRISSIKKIRKQIEDFYL